MFRDRFWLSLALTIPIIFYSPMIQEWFGYTAPVFPGSEWVGPVLGTVIFIYGGMPFLRGAAQEVRDRQPGMMLLIGMAITVAYLASQTPRACRFSSRRRSAAACRCRCTRSP